MNISFDNKKVLITGGTRGIGQKIAQEFSKHGAQVIITGTKEQSPSWLEETSTILYEKLEINNNSWHNEVSNIVEKYDGFDICINNAGINKVSKINKLEKNDLDTILLTNLNAPIYITSIVSKKMIKNQYGYIINIGSIFGSVSKKGRNPYTASKAGLIGATKTMAIDLGEFGILVNSVSPGFVDTELTKKVLGEEGMKEMAERIPLKKLAKVDDIVPMILFLCSEYNTYITGQNITVDGGFTLE